MEIDKEIERAGMKWFFIAGPIAILFSIWLCRMDNMLSTSDKEQVLGATLKELRTAQASLPARATDTRQTQPFMHEAGNK